LFGHDPPVNCTPEDYLVTADLMGADRYRHTDYGWPAILTSELEDYVS